MRLIYFALGWAAGMILATNTTARPIALWLGLSIVALIIFLVKRRDRRFLAPMLLVFGFALGGLRFAFVPVSSDVAQYNNVGGLTIEGVVVAEPDVRDTGIGLQVESETVTRIGETVPTNGLVLVQAPLTADVQ